jgi:hypothetical protein
VQHLDNCIAFLVELELSQWKKEVVEVMNTQDVVVVEKSYESKSIATNLYKTYLFRGSNG